MTVKTNICHFVKSYSYRLSRNKCPASNVQLNILNRMAVLPVFVPLLDLLIVLTSFTYQRYQEYKFSIKKILNTSYKLTEY